MSTSRFFAVTAILIVFSVGCRPTIVNEENSSSFTQVVAQVDDSYQITMAQLYESLYNSHIARNGGVLSLDQVKHFLDSLLVDTLAGYAAKDIRIEDHRETFRAFQLRYHDYVIDRYLQEAIYGAVTTDSLEVVEFYNSRPDLFTVEEQVFIYHILISPRGLWYGPDSVKYAGTDLGTVLKAAAEKAWEIRRMITSLDSFMELAREHSHDTVSGRNGGVAGWTTRGRYIDPFDSVAFGLQPGEVSDPYLDDHGWHILYCDGREAEHVAPLDSGVFLAADINLRREKANEIGRELLDSLFANTDVVYNEKLLDSNLFLVDEQVWVAVVNGVDTIRCADARGIQINMMSAYGLGHTTAEQKKEILSRPVQRFSLLQAARDMKIDTLPDVINERQHLYHKNSKAVFLRNHTDVSWRPTEADINEYYEKNKASFVPAKPLVVQHIIVEDSLFGEFLREQAMSGVDFMELAKKEYPGAEDVKLELADLGEIGPEDMPEPFWQMAMRTPESQVSHPVKTEFGYHIIKVIEKRRVLTVDLARAKIVEALSRQHKEEEFVSLRDELYKRFNVQFPETLKQVYLKPVALRG